MLAREGRGKNLSEQQKKVSGRGAPTTWRGQRGKQVRR